MSKPSWKITKAGVEPKTWQPKPAFGPNATKQKSRER
jgi:hypothetical protein